MSTDDIVSDDMLLTKNVENDMPNVEIPNRYELPPRSTRGIPPRIYDPEFEAQRSRYPVNRENNKALSQTAVAFNTLFIPILCLIMLKNLFEIQTGKKRWKKRSMLLTKMKHVRSVTC